MDIYKHVTHEKLEELAELEHTRWSDWMKYMFTQGRPNPDGTWTMPAWAVTRWQKQMQTKYADLSDMEKRNDRAEVVRYLSVMYEE